MRKERRISHSAWQRVWVASWRSLSLRYRSSNVYRAQYIAFKLDMTDKHDLNNLPFDLTETDRENLASGDENFKPHTWEEIEEIIGMKTPHISPYNCLSSSFPPSYSNKQPLNPQTQTLRPAPLHPLDKRHKIQLRLHHKLRPPRTSLLDSSPRFPFHHHPQYLRPPPPLHKPHPLRISRRLQNPSQRLAVWI